MGILLALLISTLSATASTAPTVQGAGPSDADDILAQFSKVRLDKTEIHNIRDVTLRRDVLTIAFDRGTIAFLEPINGKVTGAVFIGSGEIVAIPPDGVEKQQIYKFTGTPILNEPFQTAILRFSDSTFEDVRKEIAQHAIEEVSAEDAAQFDSWAELLGGRSTSLNLRLLTDFLEPPRTFFLAELNGEKRGWFDVAFDARATEEVSMFQIRQIGTAAVADIWASFNQRSESRNPEAVAHEHKSPIEIAAYDIDGTSASTGKSDLRTTVHMKALGDGARVLNFELSPALQITSIATEKDEPVPFYRPPNSVTVMAVLNQPLRRGQEFSLKFAYSGESLGRGTWYPSQRQQSIPSIMSSLSLPSDNAGPVFEYSGFKVIPATYHDQWLIDSLKRYLGAMSSAGTDPASAPLRKLLNDSRDELKPVEGAGAIWLGERLVSTLSPDALRAVHAKGVWVIHMLHVMLRQNGANPDSKFVEMLEEFAKTYHNRAASTWDFKHLAEKYAGEKLDWFFDQWVFDIGVPSYSVDYKIESSGNQFSIEGTISQTGVPDGFVAPVPVFGDDEHLGTVRVGESDGQFKFRVNRKPDRVSIDPEMTVLTFSSR
jgi:hypothetical protein